MVIPEDLLYTKDHEWGRREDTSMRVGISDYAQSELGDIVFVELEKMGTRVRPGEKIGTVESVKAVSEIFSPVSGAIIEVNRSLEQSPEMINTDCYGDAWMVLIAMDDPSETAHLMDAQAYRGYLEAEAK
ncbi:MAG: glycine cleavage system protein GcvH [Desulfomonilia bacterium]|nr:glycine cleavage system protein GcvH [Desulfomonilia bacterium]